jgi:hypothetical protein
VLAACGPPIEAAAFRAIRTTDDVVAMLPTTS